jgi:hypothetical protein
MGFIIKHIQQLHNIGMAQSAKNNAQVFHHIPGKNA